MSKTLIAILSAGVMGAAIAAAQVITIEGTPLKPVTATEASALKGEFQMSDGRVLYLNRKGKKLMAEIEGVPALELKVAGDKRLVSANGQMDLAYKAASNGSVSTVTLKITKAAP